LVAIDVAKTYNHVAVELHDGQRKRFKIANKIRDYHELGDYLKGFRTKCVIGLEATGNYHRPLAHFLQSEGFSVKLLSSLALARTREARYNSWDKNDPKDAQVMLHMLKTGLTQVFCDPLVHGFNDIQEISRTYYQVSLRKTRVQHSIITHFLPLYFPEAEKYMTSTRAEWFSDFLSAFPIPAAIVKYSKEEFIKKAWDYAGKKMNKQMWLTDVYHSASESIGLPVSDDSEAVAMFRIVLKEYGDLCRRRREIEAYAGQYLKYHADYQMLQTIPGIGRICALTILAEAGNLRRFSHHKKFLKYCGLDLSTQQSGRFKGISKISKHGSRRLRQAFWLAAIVAIRLRENTFRTKYERYIASDPKNKDLHRKAYTAVAAKMARVAYSLIKSGQDYRCFHEEAVPGGRIPAQRAVEAI
jgi:transposase